MNLFGRSKPSAAAPTPSGNSGGGNNTGTGDAIAKLRDASETMQKREEHLLRKIDGEISKAKEFSAKGKKHEALTCLKRKKMYEKQVEQITNAKMTLETQQLALENVNLNVAVLSAQKAGADAMTRATKQIGGVEGVEEIVDSVEEGLQDADEIGQAMGRSINSGIDMDDDELLAELEGLEQEDLTDQLTNVSVSAAPAGGSSRQAQMSAEEAELEALNASMNFPSAPLNRPAAASGKTKMTEEERELAELEASMAM